MQSKENSTANASIDTRSFQQIWAGLATSQRTMLKIACLGGGVARSEKTVYNWANGLCYPSTMAVRKEVSRIVNRELGIKTTGRTIFPSLP